MPDRPLHAHSVLTMLYAQGFLDSFSHWPAAFQGHFMQTVEKQGWEAYMKATVAYQSDSAHAHEGAVMGGASADHQKEVTELLVKADYETACQALHKAQTLIAVLDGFGSWPADFRTYLHATAALPDGIRQYAGIMVDWHSDPANAPAGAVMPGLSKKLQAATKKRLLANKEFETKIRQTLQKHPDNTKGGPPKPGREPKSGGGGGGGGFMCCGGPQ